LSESHRQILIPASEISQSQVALIPLDTTTELAVGKKADQLRKNSATLIHWAIVRSPAKFKSRQPRNDPNLFDNNYLQPILLRLTGQ
jgi:hypothetical protein